MDFLKHLNPPPKEIMLFSRQIAGLLNEISVGLCKTRKVLWIHLKHDRGLIN